MNALDMGTKTAEVIDHPVTAKAKAEKAEKRAAKAEREAETVEVERARRSRDPEERMSLHALDLRELGDITRRALELDREHPQCRTARLQLEELANASEIDLPGPIRFLRATPAPGRMPFQDPDRDVGEALVRAIERAGFTITRAR